MHDVHLYNSVSISTFKLPEYHSLGPRHLDTRSMSFNNILFQGSQGWVGGSYMKGWRCSLEISKNTLMGYQDPFLWVWFEIFFIPQSYQF